jgi:DNA-binding NarL/FixJ family response regulator
MRRTEAYAHRPSKARSLSTRLSPRQKQVVDLLLNGCTNADIAKELKISVKMVEAHVKHACRHFGASNRVNLALFSQRQSNKWPIEPHSELRPHLSLQEERVIGLVTFGLKNRDIAEVLGVKEVVVANYLQSIYDKLGRSNRVDLALWYEVRRYADEEEAFRHTYDVMRASLLSIRRMAAKCSDSSRSRELIETADNLAKMIEELVRYKKAQLCTRFGLEPGSSWAAIDTAIKDSMKAAKANGH